MLFDNYGQYIKDVLTAARNMTPRFEVKITKLIGGIVVAVMLCAIAMISGKTVFAHAEVKAALESVSAEMSSKSIIIQVNDDSDTSIAAMLSDRPNNLSAKDEAAISERIHNSITDNVLANASGSFNADGKLEIEMITEEGIPIVIEVIKDSEGNYSIDKIIAKLDAKQAKDKKQEVSSSITNDATKNRYSVSLAVFDESFDKIAGITEDMDDEARSEAYAAQMVVLADELILALPNGYSEQETDSATSTKSETTTLFEDKNNVHSEEKLSADKVEPYSYAYKSTDDGSIISIRAENLGAAFTSMNGLDGINKMKEYWGETATNVSTGANQNLKDEEEGFVTEVFYDPISGMWGYFGHVEFTDGTRDVVYNRVVFVDELADQLITVSYRHDCAIDEGNALSLADFKEMFMNAPGTKGQDAKESVLETADIFDVAGEGMATNIDDIGVADGSVDEPSNMISARSIYEDKLYQIQILPGNDMTEPARIAKEEADRIAAEHADDSEDTSDSGDDNDDSDSDSDDAPDDKE